MKYLIKESQFDKVIFKYLDNQDFVVMNEDEYIYFLNSESDNYAQIKFDKYDSWCNISIAQIDEISSFFSMREYDSERVIVRWIEDTLQMKVTNILPTAFGQGSELTISN